jgi:type IV secretion system protein VirB11
MIELQNNSKLQFLFGEAILSALSDPQVTDVMVNPNGTLWLDTFEGRKSTVERLEANRIYNIICTVASLIDEVVNRAHPDIRAEIPFPVNENHQRLLRFQGAIPPIVRGPSFTIRIPSSRVFTLDEYLEAGALTWDQQEYLQAAIRNRRNILIVGNTGSGKTTFLNALIEEITGQNFGGRGAGQRGVDHAQVLEYRPLRHVHNSCQRCLKRADTD